MADPREAGQHEPSEREAPDAGPPAAAVTAAVADPPDGGGPALDARAAAAQADPEAALPPERAVPVPDGAAQAVEVVHAPGEALVVEVVDADADAEEEPGRKPVRSITDGIPALDPGNAGPGAAAFFDVDNTMMRGSSFAALAKGMADRDYFTTGEVLEFTWKQLKYVVSGKESKGDMAQATENGLAFVKGRSPDEIRGLATEVYDETMVQRLWAGSVELAEAHQALGHEVWLVSATPIEVAEEIARRLGLTGGLGTVAEVQDGKYTGRLVGPPLHGTAKVDAISRLAQERGLDLARSAAYSDSSNDIPMLSSVGSPVAVNPDGALRAHAKAQGWPIRDYRIRGKEAVRKGVPAAAAAGAAVGVAVGVAKVAKAMREGSS
ncbi:MAG TPA: HAD-IB family hydrolase [Candidatus Nanopelagicales bacterium]